MNKIVLIAFLFLSFFGFSQTNCMLIDTMYFGPHNIDYNHSSRTRGFWFQALSDFNVVGVKAGDGNPMAATTTHQSIEIIKFDSIPKEGSSSLPNPHTVLFSSPNVPYGWLTCNVEIDSGGCYGFFGAKNHSTGTTMFNSYVGGAFTPASPLKFFLNGDSTIIYRAGIQHSLALGSPPNGEYFGDGYHSHGRLDFVTATDIPQLNINQVGQALSVSVFGGLIPYTYLWNTGETTQTINPQSSGNYWVFATDANGCISDTIHFSFISTDISDNFLDNKSKLLLRIINVLGEPVEPSPNITLFYIYHDGTVEKRFILD